MKYTKYFLLSLFLFFSTASAQNGQFTIFEKMNTLNEKIPPKLSNLDIAYQFGFEYAFDKNFYGGAKIVNYPHDWAYAGLLGLRASQGYILPYADIECLLKSTGRSEMHYDVGTSVVLFPHLMPYVEANDVITASKAAYTVGLDFPIVHGLALNIAYTHAVKDNSNSASSTISYSF